jgi:hypothetical protein
MAPGGELRPAQLVAGGDQGFVSVPAAQVLRLLAGLAHEALVSAIKTEWIEDHGDGASSDAGMREVAISVSAGINLKLHHTKATERYCP